MTDMESEQRIVYEFKPGAGAQVSVNDATKGTSKGDDFGEALPLIWLGDPPNPGIKAGLRGGPCG
jgi:hypothetical protein